jgi:type IV pilus assembly protein PilY1
VSAGVVRLQTDRFLVLSEGSVVVALVYRAVENWLSDYESYARDTAAVQDGITTALNNLNTRAASGSAAATSTPNITSSDRMIFLSSYTTVQWNGDIQAQQIDPNTGTIQSGVLWSAKAQVQAQTGPSTDTRSIYTFSASGTNRLKSFTYANLNSTATVATGPMGTVTLSAETPWFDNKCIPLTNMTQCSSLDPFTQVPIANLGLNMVNFLRGQNQYEATIFRDRAFALGDTINAAPLFVGKPRLNFIDNVTPTYQVWAAQSSVANSYGQTHEISNLWVAGPGLFPTEGASNPTFTIFAVSQRGACRWRALGPRLPWCV